MNYQGSEPPPDTFKGDAQALAIGTFGQDGVPGGIPPHTWRGYFGFCETPWVLKGLDSWIRRRVRSAFRRQWKTGRKRFAELVTRGVSAAAAKAAGSRCGPWRVSQSPPLDRALSNAYLASLGLPSLAEGL